MDVLSKPAESTLTTTANNAASAATLAVAGAGFKWRITDFWANFDSAAVATPVICTVTINGTAYKFGVSTNVPLVMNLHSPIESETNGAPSISLVAGGVGANGNVGISAFKVQTLPVGVSA